MVTERLFHSIAPVTEKGLVEPLDLGMAKLFWFVLVLQFLNRFFVCLCPTHCIDNGEDSKLLQKLIKKI